MRNLRGLGDELFGVFCRCTLAMSIIIALGAIAVYKILLRPDPNKPQD